MFRSLFLALTAAVLLFGQSWQTVTDLPGADWSGLTPAQKQVALKVLRSGDCPCGCPMKLAQCRVEDPACSQSRALTEIVIASAKAGKNEEGVRRALADSALLKQASQRDRVLLDPVELRVENAPSTGPASARITLVEFSDFQCPFCIKAVGQLKAALKAYPNDVRMVFKQFPLDSHPQARLGAQASLAAHKQGKFWQMHDRLYANPRAITRANVLAWAKEFGMDESAFAAALDSAEVKATVDRELAEGESAGVEGTPTVFVNGKKYRGSLEPAAFLPILAAELKAK